MNYDDCQGHPMWFEKIERSHGGPGSQKYPLHLQSVHPVSDFTRSYVSRKLCVSNIR